MERSVLTKTRLRERLHTYVNAENPLRQIADNWAKMARLAIGEANSLTLENVRIELKRLPKKIDGYRVIHLSDIHHSPFTGADHIERVVRVTNRLKPDLIVLTGDYVSHHREYIAPVAELLGRLSAAHGVHACLGNHDHWTDAEMVIREFRNAGINVLVNEGFRLDAGGGSFWLAGVDDHMVGKTDVGAALTGSFPDEMKVLLAHNPVIFREAARYGVDLTLSGHTHGGQIRVRDPQRKLIPGRRKAGLHRKHDSQLYITRGIGTVVVPVRYHCPPEISLLEFRAVQ
jgi:predicted MPP superfamily phosphohydrolase